MLLGFAGEDRDAERLRLSNILGNLLQHRQATGDVEAADHHLDAGLAQRPRDIDRAGEFVGLHADNADEPEPAMLGDAAHELPRHDAGVGLVDGNDVDRKIGAEHARSAAPLARLNTAASEFDGMVERSHCTT